MQKCKSVAAFMILYAALFNKEIEPVLAGTSLSSSSLKLDDGPIKLNIKRTVSLVFLLFLLPCLANAELTLVSSYDTPNYANGVVVSGNYAYVADGYSGLRVIDISNPASPIEVGSYDTTSFSGDVKIFGNYAYVSDAFSGLRIIDISNPANPVEVGFYDTEYAWSVAISGSYAYVADYDSGLRIIDISNPVSPIEVGSYDTPGNALDVAIVGNYAYVADDNSGLRIIDVSNPTSPKEVGFYDTPSVSFGVAVSGNYAYVADGYSGLRVIDISNPASPMEVGFYDMDYAQDLVVSGSHAYVADYGSGLRVINISMPTNPVEVDSYDTPSLSFDVAISGRYVYVADYISGLQILKSDMSIEILTLYQAFDYVRITTSAYESDLPDILQHDASIRNNYINSIKLIDSASADLGKDSPQRQEIYDFYIDLLNSHPQLYQRETIYNKDTQSVMAHTREKVYSSLINTQLYGNGLDTSEKWQISSAIGLSGRRLNIWSRFGVLLLDNNLLSSRQLDFLYNYLDALPADIHNLHTVSVLDFLGDLPSGTPGMGIWTKDGAINIFGTEIGVVSGNPFPSDISPRVDDMFCGTVAHEVNHIVDAYNSQKNPDFAERRANIISRAGCPHLNYLRSMFEDCFFANAPQEFFASIANQYFSDSCHTLELGVSRFQSGYHEPINQLLFYADAYSKGTGQTNFYKIDSNGNIQRYAIPLMRDSHGHIRSLICDGKEYEFALDSEGYVQNITVKEIEPLGILYYPDFTDTANPDSWRSWLVLQNPNNSDAHVNLEIRSRAGDLLYSGGQMIPAHGAAAIRPRNMVGSDCAGSVIVTSDQPITGSCQITRNSNEMCMGYNALDHGSTALYYPDFTDSANPDSWRSWLVLQNPGASQASLNLKIRSRTGILLYSGSLTIPAHSANAIRPRNLAGGDCAGSVVITSDRPIVGTCQITRNSNKMCMSYTASDQGSTTLYYPDFTDTTNPDGWRSWLVLQNPSSSPASLTYKIRSRAGDILYTGSDAIPAYSVNAIRPKNLVGSDCTGSVVVTSDRPIVGTCQITRNNNEMCMSYNALDEGLMVLNYPDFTDTANPDSWRSWLVLQNPTASESIVILKIRSRAGDLIYSGPQGIPAQGVWAIRPRGLVGADCSGSVTVTSDQPIVGTCQISRNNNLMCMSYTAAG